jgi:hypothetical protein
MFSIVDNVNSALFRKFQTHNFLKSEKKKKAVRRTPSENTIKLKKNLECSWCLHVTWRLWEFAMKQNKTTASSSGLCIFCVCELFFCGGGSLFANTELHWVIWERNVEISNLSFFFFTLASKKWILFPYLQYIFTRNKLFSLQ